MHSTRKSTRQSDMPLQVIATLAGLQLIDSLRTAR